MKLSHSHSIAAVLLFITLPLFTHAAPYDFTDIGSTITNFNKQVVATLATLFIAGGVAAFFFGVTQFIFASRDADAKKMNDGKNFMLWSVIALFIMFSIYGIINFGQGLIPGLDKTQIEIPSFNFGGTSSGGNTGLPGNSNQTPTNPYGSSASTDACDGKALDANCITPAGQPGTCQRGGASSDYKNVCRVTTTTYETAPVVNGNSSSNNTNNTSNTGSTYGGVCDYTYPGSQDGYRVNGTCYSSDNAVNP